MMEKIEIYMEKMWYQEMKMGKIKLTANENFM